MSGEFERIFNLVEGLFWIGVGVGFLVSLVRPRGRWAKAVAGVNFGAFGVSDVAREKG